MSCAGIFLDSRIHTTHHLKLVLGNDYQTDDLLSRSGFMSITGASKFKSGTYVPDHPDLFSPRSALKIGWLTSCLEQSMNRPFGANFT